MVEIILNVSITTMTDMMIKIEVGIAEIEMEKWTDMVAVIWGADGEIEIETGTGTGREIEGGGT